MSKKKVSICISSLGLGGAEEIIVRLANSAAQNWEVDVLLVQRCNEDVERVNSLSSDVRLRTIFPRTSGTKSIEFRLKNLLAYLLSPLLAIYAWFFLGVSQAQVVHVNLTQFSLMSVFWAFLAKISCRKVSFVQTFHTNLHLLRNWQRIVFRISWQVCEKLVVEIDEDEVGRVSKFVHPSKILFIPFAVPKVIAYSRCRYASVAEPLVFGSLARVRLFEKKYDLILDALRILKERGLPFLYLIGGDGPDMEKVQSLVVLYGLEDRVSLLGFVANPNDFFVKIDCLVVATVSYETGICGLQALQAGVPLVGVNTISDGAGVITGASVSPDKAMELANSAEDLAVMLEGLIVNRGLEKYYSALCREKCQYLDDTKMMERYRVEVFD